MGTRIWLHACRTSTVPPFSLTSDWGLRGNPHLAVRWSNLNRTLPLSCFRLGLHGNPHLAACWSNLNRTLPLSCFRVGVAWEPASRCMLVKPQQPPPRTPPLLFQTGGCVGTLIWLYAGRTSTEPCLSLVSEWGLRGNPRLAARWSNLNRTLSLAVPLIREPSLTATTSLLTTSPTHREGSVLAHTHSPGSARQQQSSLGIFHFLVGTRLHHFWRVSSLS